MGRLKLYFRLFLFQYLIKTYFRFARVKINNYIPRQHGDSLCVSREYNLPLC